MSFVASELQKPMCLLYDLKLENANPSPVTVSFLKDLAAKKLAYLDAHVIGDRKYLVGESFTIADSHLYVILSWLDYVEIDMTPYTNLKRYYEHLDSMENICLAKSKMDTHPTKVVGCR